MRRVKIRPQRFIVFILIVAAVVAGVCILLANRKGGELEVDSLRLEWNTKAVIIRDETVVSTEKYDKITFNVAEGERISNDTEVAQVYKWGYQEESTQSLINVQKEILAYSRAQVADVVNTEYEAVTAKINSQLERIRNHDGKESDLLLLEQELKNLLQERNTILRNSVQQDETLSGLYKQEEEQLANLAGWKRSIINTAGDGIVSFYFDGYEQALKADRLDLITADVINGVLKGTKTSTQSASSTGSSRENLLYRLINNNHWYIAFLSDASNPQRVVKGEEYVVYFNEYRDIPFTAVAAQSTTYNGKVVNILEFHEDIGNMLGVRVVSVTIKKDATGIRVPLDAITTQDGESTIELVYGTGTRTVAVDLLTSDDNYAIIRPKDEKEVLVSGQEYKKS